jgi:hypothetical protein
MLISFVNINPGCEQLIKISAHRASAPVSTIHFQEYWQKPTVYNCSLTNLEISRLDRAKFSEPTRCKDFMG